MGDCLVIIEAGAKQRYIFATNKRREAVGASELVHRVGGAWLDDALAGLEAREVTRTSGLAVLLVGSADEGRQVVRAVTRRAIGEAAGLDVYGTVSEPLELHSAEDLRDAQKRAFRQLAQVRADRPGPAARHLRLPIVAECATSGLPAAGLWSEGGQALQPRSRQSLDKLAAADAGLQRMAQGLDLRVEQLRRAVDRLEEAGELVAVLHADGNGLGRVFTEFDAGTDDLDEHIATLRAFSTAVDRCSRGALVEAMAELDGPSDVLPLIVGGDDLTLICRASESLALAASYLRAFERLTGEDPVLADRCAAMLGHPRLTAAAGVAVVKPHFPFSVAYGMASDLCDRAKQLVREPELAGSASALDFHVVTDSSPVDLEVHRALPDGNRAVVRPVLVGRPDHRRSLERIEAAARIVADPAGLPRSAWYAIRADLAQGAALADARYRARKAERGIAEAALLGPSLFEPGLDGAQVTPLGDALDLLDLGDVPAADSQATAGEPVGAER